MDNLIQCEFCEIYINFDEYSEHILECFENKSAFSSLTSSIMTSLTSSIYTDNNNESDSDNDDNDDDTEYEIFRTMFNINVNNSNNFNFYNPYQNLEDVKKPVKNIDLVAPIVLYNSIPEDTYCSICQDKISSNPRKTLCNHYYCSDCLIPWLKINKTCPSCLADLENLNKEVEENKEEENEEEEGDEEEDEEENEEEEGDEEEDEEENEEEDEEKDEEEDEEYEECNEY
jgi:hypothetical protein